MDVSVTLKKQLHQRNIVHVQRVDAVFRTHQGEPGLAGAAAPPSLDAPAPPEDEVFSVDEKTAYTPRQVFLEKGKSQRIFDYVFSNSYPNFWQTLRGSFSAVSKPNFASKYSFESS